MTAEDVGRYIERHGLLDSEATHIVALSGGADSVALLCVLNQLGYTLHAAHCNFHLRGEEADRDEAFCVSLCQRMGIGLHLAHFDTRTYAQTHRVSIEMAARELRYRYFEQLRQDIGAASICVAHHRDDQVETVLMNLLRGTGIKGLAGIAPRNGYVIRPLLSQSRQELEAYLRSMGQEWVTDSTNLIDDVTRNKIRLRVLPLLDDINPATREHIAQAAEHVAAANDFAERQADELLSAAGWDEGQIDLRKMLSTKGCNYLMHKALSDKGYNSSQIAEILRCVESTGRKWNSKTHVCTIDRGTLIVRPRREQTGIASREEMRIPEPGTYHMGDGFTYRIHEEERTAEFKPSRDPWTATLDADKVRFPITIRAAAQGDRFAPYGMKGTKLVSDYLTDRKKNLFEKQDQQVAVDARGNILWLIGERTADIAAVTHHTTRVLRIQVAKSNRR